MSQSPIQTAIKQICQEKNLSEEAVLHAIELALAAAYRKDFGNKLQNIIAEFDPKTGGVKVVDFKTVVEDVPEEELAALEAEENEKAVPGGSAPGEEEKKVALAKSADKDHKTEKFFVSENEEEEEEVHRFNPKTEIQISEAKKIDKKYKIGDEIITPLEVPGEFGRMAAQTAKQVIIQKIREVERENIFNEYKTMEGQVVNGTVQRREGRNVLVDLEHATALMPLEEQIYNERYSVGNRMKFYLVSVEQTTRGPQLIVSRSHKEIVKKIFEMEIPEVANGVIEIKSIAREAGHRSKVAIYTADSDIDPIGSCVGQRGARIQTIIHELNGEKVDIILWDEDSVKFITNALSPAKILSVELEDQENKKAKDQESKDDNSDDGDAEAKSNKAEEIRDEKVAKVMVKEDQLSLAIGRSGQNVRLASKLTGWKIDIVNADGEAVSKDSKKEDESASVEATADKEEKAEEPAEEAPAEEKDKEKKEVEKSTKKESKLEPGRE